MDHIIDYMLNYKSLFMNRTLTLVGILLLLVSMNTYAGDYKLDQSKINAMFENATDITSISAFDLNSFNGLESHNAVLDEKDPVIALVLATVLGGFGVHRLYLGTKPVNALLYIITGGGCGVVVAVDWIMLLMVLIDDEKGLGPYIDNDSFIMWKDQM